MSSHSHQPPAEEQLFESENFEAELFWGRHRNTIIIAAVAVLVVAAAVAFWFIARHNTRLASEAAFAQASNPEAWREVIAKFPGSEPAANASFLLAESLREQGNLEESNAVYQKFLEVFPAHPLAGGARLGLAENLFVAGKADDALVILHEIQSKDSATYAAPVSMLLEGRSFVRQGKLGEARKILSNLISSYPQSPAARIAGAQLESIMPLLPPETPKPAAAQ